jgi:glycosyltransferase involved in cell wall biosynthesis
MKYSIIIATYNRAAELRETLKSISAISSAESWEIIVVDNNSIDETPDVVASAARELPAPVRYVFEPKQGRCAALNAGIGVARGEIILTTDDDVRVEPDWLDQAGSALDRLGCDYVGGRVLPIWKAPRPRWLPNRGGRHWAVVALLDYGEQPVEFGERVPLGANMAIRREAFTRAGLWDNRVGRKAGTLIGQEVREWGLRARAAGLKGFYAPNLVLHHVIHGNRLRKRYFRRWFYWHGISRAILYHHTRADMEAPEATSLDFSKVPHVAGVPRYLYRTFLRSLVGMVRASMKKDAVAAFEHELWLWFFAGIVRRRWADHRTSGRKGGTRPEPGFNSAEGV